MIQAAIAAALAGASPLPFDGATAMADDFARLCLSQANAFPGTVALAHAAGWSNDRISGVLTDLPALRDTLLFSPAEPDLILTIGFKTAYSASPHTACAISYSGAAFAETVDAMTVRMARAPSKREDAIAVWMPEARSGRLVAVSKSIGGIRNAMGIIAIDLLEEKAVP
ncbi:hypothetical protein ACCC88_15365 [Sphingomonas sp. Sphisp140]|uniref:hypothetical protein n=1 Tax=unclassified Sphingomonas TaxID=196159 RepID=UPI0039AFEE7D